MAVNRSALLGEPDETVRTPGNGMSPAGWDRYTQNSEKIYQSFVDANLAAGMTPEDARNLASTQYSAWGEKQHNEMYSDANAAPFGVKELAPLAGNNGLNAPLAILGAGSAATWLGGGAAAGDAAAGGTGAGTTGAAGSGVEQVTNALTMPPASVPPDPTFGGALTQTAPGVWTSDVLVPAAAGGAAGATAAEAAAGAKAADAVSAGDATTSIDPNTPPPPPAPEPDPNGPPIGNPDPNGTTIGPKTPIDPNTGLPVEPPPTMPPAEPPPPVEPPPTAINPKDLVTAALIASGLLNAGGKPNLPTYTGVTVADAQPGFAGYSGPQTAEWAKQRAREEIAKAMASPNGAGFKSGLTGAQRTWAG